MTILFDASRTARKNPAIRFGAGILADSGRTRVLDHTVSDDAWWVAECAKLEDIDMDRRAFEAEAQDRIERGTIL